MSRWMTAVALIVCVPSLTCAQDPALPTTPLVKLELLPPRVELIGPRAVQRLVVVGTFADGKQRDMTRLAEYRTTDGTIATVAHGAVIPASEGSTTLTATVRGTSATVPVTVKQFRQERPVDFHTDVIPLLNKQGCNQGACHGAQLGKGGFRLSLFGFDPEFDYDQIVKSAKGRRVVLADPERSILLQKPALAMEHGGGERLKPNSAEYQLLKQWLEEGASPPSATAPKVSKLTVYPPERLMQPGEQQQIVVLATWSDGRTVDVTATAQYDALSEAFASVTPDGLTQCKRAGETAIMIRYCGQATIFSVTSPYAPLATLDFPAQNFIDKHLAAKWRSLGLVPSPLASDETFLRRVHLDTIGTVPTPEEIHAFLADNDPQKRTKVIDKLLERPEFIDFWTLKWGDLLRINRDALEQKGMWSFHQWIRSALRDNMPVDEFVREIITAEGSTYREGPSNFYRIGNNAEDWSETVSQVFLGVRMQCAKCHHHPFEKWSQEDYYGMTAFFVRMGRKNSQEFGLFGRETVVFLRPSGEARHPRKNVIVKPHPLDGEEVDDPFDRRRQLAEWITAKENPLFARNIVNRFWGYFMGRGLVEPLDDLRATNPATIPELLDTLAADFVRNNYNLKHLIRTILASRAYQLSSVGTPENAADAENLFHTRYQVKRLTAEQLADALDDATGTREKYPGLPLGTRAIQLPDTQVRSYLMDVFGRPARQITCECERTMTPNIAQALHLVNSDFLNAKLTRPDGRLDRLFRAKTPLPEVVEELYLVTLCRAARPDERVAALKLIGQAQNPRQGAEDLLWALVNSRGFLFNH